MCNWSPLVQPNAQQACAAQVLLRSESQSCALRQPPLSLVEAEDRRPSPRFRLPSLPLESVNLFLNLMRVRLRDGEAALFQGRVAPWRQENGHPAKWIGSGLAVRLMWRPRFSRKMGLEVQHAKLNGKSFR